MIIEYSKSLVLTRNFTLGEFVVSSEHPTALASVILTDVEIQRFYLLCVLLLQPVRDRFGSIRVTSAYRTDKLNRLVNGTHDSQHCLAEAVDFIPSDFSPHSVYLHIANEWPGEVIYYEAEGRLHVALPRLGTKADHFTKKA